MKKGHQLMLELILLNLFVFFLLSVNIDLFFTFIWLIYLFLYFILKIKLIKPIGKVSFKLDGNKYSN